MAGQGVPVHAPHQLTDEVFGRLGPGMTQKKGSDMERAGCRKQSPSSIHPNRRRRPEREQQYLRQAPKSLWEDDELLAHGRRNKEAPSPFAYQIHNHHNRGLGVPSRSPTRLEAREAVRPLRRLSGTASAAPQKGTPCESQLRTPRTRRSGSQCRTCRSHFFPPRRDIDSKAAAGVSQHFQQSKKVLRFFKQQVGGLARNGGLQLGILSRRRNKIFAVAHI